MTLTFILQVKHGIFRSSPFFLAIQEAFEFGEVKEVRNVLLQLTDLCAPVLSVEYLMAKIMSWPSERQRGHYRLRYMHSCVVCIMIFIPVRSVFDAFALFYTIICCPGAALALEAFGQDKATLFFKLHELQTCSFGASKVREV